MRPTRIKKGNKYFRIRDGKLVEIPNQWVGVVTHPQTIRKRQSKKTGKIKNQMQCDRRDRQRRGFEFISRTKIKSFVCREIQEEVGSVA